MRTTPSTSHSSRHDPIAGALAADRLNARAIIFFTMSAAAPLTVVAGLVPTAYAVTGSTVLPAAFLIMGVVLAAFSTGYVAMARHMPSAGALYTYISRGLGRPAGVGAAWVALIAYNCMQTGLYGAVGSALTPMLYRWFGISPPWWLIALAAWALVAVLGVMRVGVNSRVLAILLVAEVTAILVLDVTDLFHPAADMAVEMLSPAVALTSPGLGPSLMIAAVGFVGFESAATFSEESREPGRTVPRATYATVAIIAGLYALSAWAMAVAIGPGAIVETARRDGARTIFVLAAGHWSSLMVDIVQVLFVTGLVAAKVAFHGATARYAFALGRERLLPAAFGRTRPRSGAPLVGSIAQSVLGLAVIVTYAVAGLDPLVDLFYFVGTAGGFGVLLLIFVTSIAVIYYFARHAHGQDLRQRLIRLTPAAMAAGALATIMWLISSNFAALLGVPQDHWLVTFVPQLYVTVAALGVQYGVFLRWLQPNMYARIGMGAKAALPSTPLN
ncbi:APC family permease [Nonomuraea sp. NEAU-A123]|uniref:APC family permease n=1 Tax=Nonomuraea sp. NEAU-A123 TaxID=2839649 RepID=UPI001BE3DFD4|nr:APC family permease [Nonomuraea sp. NEAU-A123]MBT2234730.1 APC family permease [Nonomuraea sp. NEAU-A123]